MEAIVTRYGELHVLRSRHRRGGARERARHAAAQGSIARLRDDVSAPGRRRSGPAPGAPGEKPVILAQVRRHRAPLRSDRRCGGADRARVAGADVARRISLAENDLHLPRNQRSTGRSVDAFIGVLRVPIPSISIVTTSPGLRYSLRSAPVPDGVPVAIRSPGNSVMFSEM